ncbi:MAG: hypothetical protein ACR2GN_06150 [Bacteroidia bacterium]
MTILLGAYFSALVAMIIFTGLFVYSNLGETIETKAASDHVNQVIHNKKSSITEEPVEKASGKVQSASLKELK